MSYSCCVVVIGEALYNTLYRWYLSGTWRGSSHHMYIWLTGCSESERKQKRVAKKKKKGKNLVALWCDIIHRYIICICICVYVRDTLTHLGLYVLSVDPTVSITILFVDENKAEQKHELDSLISCSYLLSYFFMVLIYICIYLCVYVCVICVCKSFC